MILSAGCWCPIISEYRKLYSSKQGSPYIEAISDSEAMMNPNPINVQTNDQNNPAMPPFSKPWELELDKLAFSIT